MESISGENSNSCTAIEFVTESLSELSNRESTDIPKNSEAEKTDEIVLLQHINENNISKRNSLNEKLKKCRPSHTDNTQITPGGNEMTNASDCVLLDNDIEVLDNNVECENDIEILDNNVGQINVGCDNDIEMLDNSAGQINVGCDNDIEILDNNVGQSNVGFDNDIEILHDKIDLSDDVVPDNDIEILGDNTDPIDNVAPNNNVEILGDNTDQIDNVAPNNNVEILGDNTDQIDNVAPNNNVEILGDNTDQINSVAPDNNVEILDDNISQNDSFEIEYDFKHVPYQVTGSWKEFTNTNRNNFTRGCKWAPDGSCILTCSDDNILRIFNLPYQFWDSSQWDDISEMEAVVKISEGEIIYDYSWYPLMNSSDAVTCCLASSSKNSTVHLWDGFTGELRCSYRTYNHMDEIVTPHSLSFDAGGQKLFCGFEKVIRIFDVDTPGREFDERYIFAQKIGQSGIVSCFAFTPADRNISAVGTYHKTIGIYSEPSGNLECVLEGQKGGITQLQFSPDGTCLYSGGRKDSEILCWDTRNLGSVLFSLRRSCTTNQRMYFDISRCGKYVISGNQNGVITVWDVTKEAKVINEEDFSVMEPVQFFLGHDDCVNGISLHPTLPLLCSSSGQRKFPNLLADDEEEMFSPKIDKCDNSLRLWWLGKKS